MQRLIFPLLSSALLLILSTSCGYHHTEEEGVSSTYQKIAVPYIKGDIDGKLTDALIKRLGQSAQLGYSSGLAALIFEGEVIGNAREYVGYQYDREPKSGKRINRLVPNEERREITIRFSLKEEGTGAVLYGPIEVTASSDYDFFDSDSLRDVSFIDSSGQRQSSLFFSLGQLDSRQGASEIALEPIYRRLADEIIQGIENLSLKKSFVMIKEKND
jgi:hypothetical protein